MRKKYDIVSIGVMAYDMILRTVDETLFTRDTTLLEDVGVSVGGGSVIQTITAQRLGCKTAVVGKLCRDSFSDDVMKALSDAGVDASHVVRSAEDSMSLTFALVRPDGTRHFLGLAGSNNQRLCLGDFELSVVTEAKIVSYGSFFFLKGLDRDGAPKIFDTARQAGALTVADCSSDSFHQGREIVLRNLPAIDYFIPSRVEAEYLTQEREPAFMAKALLARGCRHVIIKLGREGCYVTDGHISKVVRAFPVENVRDTTGAGDTFVGGFMAGLIDEMDLFDAARYANAAAAVSVTGVGAVTALKDKAQVLAIMRGKNKEM